jgi:hypothetical protein
MYGEDGPAINVSEVASVIAETEVMLVGFAICAERLLIDLRADATTAPLVELVEPLANARERAVWLSARRSSLGAPERSVFIPWPHSIAFLERCGVLARAADRIRSEHGVDVTRDIEQVLSELRRHERDFASRAIRGAEGFETLWSASA